MRFKKFKLARRGISIHFYLGCFFTQNKIIVFTKRSSLLYLINDFVLLLVSFVFCFDGLDVVAIFGFTNLFLNLKKLIQKG